MKMILSGLILLGSLVAYSQPPNYPSAPATRTVVRGEYFFNADPGFGNGTAIMLTPAMDINSFTTSINLTGSALRPGIHRLYLRTQDNEGHWSHAGTSLFTNMVLIDYPVSPGNAPNLVEVEYFIDTDPGAGNGTRIPLPASPEAPGQSLLVNIAGVPQGSHRLFVRTRDVNGKWSLTNFTVFSNSVQIPYPAAPGAPQPLTSAEYFFDTDPGFGNGTQITIPASTEVADFSISVPVGSLSQGRHTLYVRSKENPWSLTAFAEFHIGSVLPVQWLFVKAEERGDDAVISWATAAEHQADKFVIEQSGDGIQFSPIGEVKALNSGSGGSYTFRHAAPGSGIGYYRIKQLDTDGKFTYSKVLMLAFNRKISRAVLFPNPSSSIVHILFPAGQKAERVSLHNSTGQKVKDVIVSMSGNVLSIPTGELAKGQYFLILSSGKATETLRFVKH